MFYLLDRVFIHLIIFRDLRGRRVSKEREDKWEKVCQDQR